MLVVPDIDSVFLPLSEEVIFVKYSDCKSNIDTLLDKLPQMFANSKVNDSSFGSAIEAATIAMVTFFLEISHSERNQMEVVSLLFRVCCPI